MLITRSRLFVFRVPGTSANVVHFQAYLVKGLVRWNAARAEAAFQPQDPAAGSALRLPDVDFQHRINALADEVGLSRLFPAYRPPAEHTGECNQYV